MGHQKKDTVSWYTPYNNAQKNPNSLEQAFRKHNHIVLDKEDLEVGRTIRVRSDWLHGTSLPLTPFPPTT